MIRPIASAAVLLAMAGCGRADEQMSAPESQVLFTLGTRQVDYDDFVALAKLRSAAGEFPRSGSGFEGLRDRILKDAVVDELLLIEAESRGLVVSDATRAQLLAAAKEESDLDAALERYGDEQAWSQTLARRALLSRVQAALRDELAGSIEVLPEQIDAARERIGPALVRPAMLHVRQVFVPDAELARQLKLSLDAGRDFVSLATEQGQGDGDLGWMQVTATPVLVSESTADLEPGQYSDVVRSERGYHIFQLVGRRAAAPPPPERERELVRDRLVEEAVDVRLNAWLAARTDELGLRMDEQAVSRVRCCALGLPYWGESPPEKP